MSFIRPTAETTSTTTRWRERENITTSTRGFDNDKMSRGHPKTFFLEHILCILLFLIRNFINAFVGIGGEQGFNVPIKIDIRHIHGICKTTSLVSVNGKTTSIASSSIQWAIKEMISNKLNQCWLIINKHLWGGQITTTTKRIYLHSKRYLNHKRWDISIKKKDDKGKTFETIYNI